MNEKIMEEVLNDCKWYEKIIIKKFNKLFIKMYHISRIEIVNKLLK